MQNRVFVINKHGKALMPCKPRKARILLRDGKAKVLKKSLLPFNSYMVQAVINKI